MYKLAYSQFDNKLNCILKNNGLTSIPINPANTDYQTFKKEVLAGAELQDADGNVIDGIAYLEGLA